MAIGNGLRGDEAPELGWIVIGIAGLIAVVGLASMLIFTPIPLIVALGGGAVVTVGLAKMGKFRQRDWRRRRR